MKVEDLDQEYELIQTDTDIQETLEYLGYKGSDSFTVLFAKIGNADYNEVYGCYGTPYLDSYVVKLFPESD